jgi:hypothetical protein
MVRPVALELSGGEFALAPGHDEATLYAQTAISFLTSVLNSTAAALTASSAVVAITWPTHRDGPAAR